jgi:hypothetical protein
MHGKRIVGRSKSLLRLLATCLCVVGVAPSLAAAGNVSFDGDLPRGDAIQPFEFNVSVFGTVESRTWSYAGGTNISGGVVSRGGFDPIVSLFDSTGLLLGFNDDSGLVVDPVSGAAWDSLLSLDLDPGSYTATITQFSNFPFGPNFSDGFQGFEAGFGDRSSHWALDIVNVDSAAELAPLTSSIPEPHIAVLLLAALGFIFTATRRRVRR